MGWDANKPVGSRAFSVGDDAIRENNAYLETALSPWMEFGDGSLNDGRPMAAVGTTLPGSPKAGYNALDPAFPGIHYYDGTVQRDLWGIPVGTIVLWTGTVSDVPDGWWQCCVFDVVLAPKGAAGINKNGVVVPNFGQRVLVGLDPSEADYDAQGVNGGIKEQVVTESNIEQFSASPGAWSGGGTANILQQGGTPVVATTTQVALTVGTVGATPLDNRQPYQVVCYIVFCAV